MRALLVGALAAALLSGCIVYSPDHDRRYGYWHHDAYGYHGRGGHGHGDGCWR